MRKYGVVVNALGRFPRDAGSHFFIFLYVYKIRITFLSSGLSDNAHTKILDLEV